MSRKYWLLLALAAILLLFFGNGSLLVTDSVESNYALTAKEMVLSGDWVSPQIFGRYWYDKPIMFYWLTAVAFKIFGFTEFAARFFPAVFGLLDLGLVAYGGYRLYNEKVGFYSAILLLSSVEFFLISKSVITDAVLFLFFSATLLFFYLGYSKGKRLFWYLMYATAGLSVLTKGPIGVLLPGLIITLFLIWQRDWRVLTRCKLVSGTLLCALIAVPWYAAMYVLHGSDFINNFFGVHNFLRATVSEHPRDNVWYYYLMVNTLALFPWSALVPYTLWRRFKKGWYLEEKEKFLLLWAAVVFFFFQNMATKYITYTYPLLFPMSIFLTHELEQREEELLGYRYMLFVGTVFAALLGAALWAVYSGRVEGESLFLLPLSIMVGLIIHCLWLTLDDKKVLGLASICICFYLALIYSVAEPFSEQRSAKALGEALAKTGQQEVGIYGPYPTSAAFYSGVRMVKLLPEKELASSRPQSMSWTSKNVMPLAAIENQAYPLIVVKEKSLEHFLKQEGRQRIILGYAKEWVIMSRQQLAVDVPQGKWYNELDDNKHKLSVQNEWRDNNGRT
ncbi:MAG: glycosyltransferase family 39 protein [Phascolarctobacterium sp.]|nr:glycosyltransferase family 39 protein [Phascolarctobacterium sp.]